MTAQSVLDWLLSGDSAIRWQALRDVADAAPRTVARERRKVATEGWGARLLKRQAKTGMWGGGLYSPKWVSTHYTLMLLRDFGLPPRNTQARRGCRLLLEHGLRPDGGINHGRWAAWTKRGETCITGMTLSLLSYFRVKDDRIDTVADNLLREQMPDGGWNCQREHGATHASVHTTISALEGLHHYEQFRDRKTRAVRAAQRSGREFLLAHRLFRSHRTGAVIKPAFLQFAFPPRWHYDVLRALDYFQAVGAPRDERLAEGIEIVRQKCRPDGRWDLNAGYRGRVFFELEKVGQPSRNITLRALRVLRWWEKGR